MQLSYEKGGCRVKNVEIFVKSLKITWIGRRFRNNSDWIGSVFGLKLINHFGSEYSRQRTKTTIKKFWKETLFCFGVFILENIDLIILISCLSLCGTIIR